MQINILTIIPYFHPAYYYGGPVRVSYEITRKLVQRGHKVTVYTTDVLDNKARYRRRTEDIEGVKVHYFRNISNHLAAHYHAFLPVGFYSFLKASDQQYDLIHIHEYYTLMSVAAARHAKKCGIPYLLSAHGSLPVTPERGNQGRKRLFNRIFSSILFKDVSRVIALNEREKRQFLDFGIEDRKIAIIPNGINVDEFKDLPGRSEFRRRYRIEENEKMILFVGRIHEIKGLDLLVRAFEELTGKIKGVKLVLVGPDDGYLRTLEELIRELGVGEKIIFTGLLSGREKLSAYVAADIFVLPSRSEGFPVTVLEACATGLPVILSDNCNFPDVEKFGAGFEIPCEAFLLSQSMEKLLADDAARKEMGGRGREMVFNNYDWDKIVARLEGIYDEAIHSKDYE